MKVISYSLYGPCDVYNFGALENALLARKLYPDFKVKIYHDNTCNIKIINELNKFDNVILVNVTENNKLNKMNKMMWRFIPAFEKDTEIYLCRDLDSNLNERDKQLVNEWINSKYDFHIIRDHPCHKTRIMGCGWGCRNNILSNLENDIYKYDKIPEKIKNRPLGFNMDQEFLKEFIYPTIIKKSLIHSISLDLIFEDENKNQVIITKRDKINFIGNSKQMPINAFKYLHMEPMNLRKKRISSLNTKMN